MTEVEIELILERAREKFPGATPRIISDNGPQFIAKDVKEYIRLVDMTHVRISPYYPQSNGKVARMNKTVKCETVRVRPPSSLEDARNTIGAFIDTYNHRRLHSAIGYIAPIDRLEGRHEAIWAERDRKLEAAREQRCLLRQAARQASAPSPRPPRQAVPC